MSKPHHRSLATLASRLRVTSTTHSTSSSRTFHNGPVASPSTSSSNHPFFFTSSPSTSSSSASDPPVEDLSVVPSSSHQFKTHLSFSILGTLPGTSPHPLSGTAAITHLQGPSRHRSGWLDEFTTPVSPRGRQQGKHQGGFVLKASGFGIPKSPSSPSKESTKSTEEHPLAEQVGEDAYFVRSDSLGIADGVGGMRKNAFADPGRWAKKIMHLCSAELARYEDVEDDLFAHWADVSPQDVLQRAFETAKREAAEEGIVGSTTALVAVLRNDELRLTNIGDGCCFIIRGRDYIFRLEEQQHSFNYPYQLSTVAEKSSVPSKDAQNFTIKIQRDDIIVLSSDGLVDNLFDDDILDEVLRFTSPHPSNSVSPEQLRLRPFSLPALSEALCSRAKAVSEDTLAVTSPFQQKAMEEGMYYVGGKKDDITTVICIVQGAEEVGRHDA